MENQSIKTNNLPIFQPSAKLNNNNYTKWVSQIIQILQHHDLYAFIDSKSTPPSENIDSISEYGTKIQTSNPKFNNWVTQDQAILAWLISTVTDQTMCHVIMAASTSLSLWLALENKFGSLLKLRTQFRNTKQGTNSVKDYLNRFKSAVKSLTAAGEKLSDQELLLRLLAGLRPEYEGFIISIITRTERPTYVEVANMLRFHERQIAETLRPVDYGTSDVRPATAVTVAVAGRRGNGGGNGLQRISGPNRFNSVKPHNYNFQRGYYKDRRDGNNLPKCVRCWQNQSCQICNVQGHSAINCRFRFGCNENR